MSTVAEMIRPASIGVALALYPSDPSLPMQIERAPDDGNGAPDTANSVRLALARPGSRAYVDLAPAGPTWWYRSRHISPAGFGSQNWTRWVSARAKRLPTVLPAVPDIAALDRWTTDVVFEPDDSKPANAAKWSAGNLVLGNGQTFAISAGASETYGNDVLFYLYWDPASPNEIQDSQTFSDVMGDGKIYLATCETTDDGEGSVTIIPVQGAPTIGAKHIRALTMAAIVGDFGIVNAGLINNAESDPTAGIRINSAYTKPATWLRYIDFAATGSQPFLKHPLFELRADGSFRLGGSFDNLCLNPGFELSDSAILGWGVVSAGGAWSIDTTNPRTGARCARYDPSGAQTASASLFAHGTLLAFAVSGGDQTYAEAWARLEGTGTPSEVRLQIQYADADGNLVASETIDSVAHGALTTTYEKLSGTHTAPSTAAWATILVVVRNTGGDGVILWDDAYARRAVDGSLVVGTIQAGAAFAGRLEIGGIRYGPLYGSGTEVRVDNSTAEETLLTVAVPQGAMGATGGWRATFILTTSGDSNGNAARILRLYWGGVEVASFTISGPGPLGAGLTLDVWCFNSTVDDQNIHARLMSDEAVLGGSTIELDGAIGSIDTSAGPVDIELTIDHGFAATLEFTTLRVATVELLAPAGPS